MIKTARALPKSPSLSPFVSVPWGGTKPTIPGCITTGPMAVPLVSWIKGSLPLGQNTASQTLGPLGFLEGVKRASLLRPTLPNKTGSYKLHALSLNRRLYSVPRLWFSYVPPTEIFGAPKDLPTYVESIHHFFYHINGFFMVCGFTSPDARAEFIKDFLRKAIPREMQKEHDWLGRDIFYGGWREGGSLVANGIPYSLALFTPQAFQAILATALVEDLDPPNCEGPNFERDVTAGGTVYIHHITLGPFRVIARDGRVYSYPPAKAGIDGDVFASHAAILKRQVDPFGLGALEGTPKLQFWQARAVVRNALKSVGIESEMLRSSTPMPPPPELAALALERLSALRAGVEKTSAASPIAHRLNQIGIGLRSWLDQGEGEPRRKYLRFVWVSAPRDQIKNRFFGVADNLLHIQIAQLLFGENLLHNAETAEVARHMYSVLRGGIVELRYSTTGRLDDLALVDDKMIVPLRLNGNVENHVIRLSDGEKADLLAELRKDS